MQFPRGAECCSSVELHGMHPRGTACSSPEGLHIRRAICNLLEGLDTASQRNFRRIMPQGLYHRVAACSPHEGLQELYTVL